MISVKRSKIVSGPHAILSGSIARSYLLCWVATAADFLYFLIVGRLDVATPDVCANACAAKSIL